MKCLFGSARANTATLGNQDYPSIAALDNGGFVVTFDSYYDGNGNGDGTEGTRVWAQQFDASGQRVDGQIRVDRARAKAATRLLAGMVVRVPPLPAATDRRYSSRLASLTVPRTSTGPVT